VTQAQQAIRLTTSLEDYLKSIFGLVRAHKVARVRDVAADRGVKAGSVTPALRRLTDLGLIRHPKHEYIELTGAGVREARRILARHSLLHRFFGELLQMPEPQLERDAHQMEHSVSDEAMDRMALLFEFIHNQPGVSTPFIEGFHSWVKKRHAEPRRVAASERGRRRRGADLRLSDLESGQRTTVEEVLARGERRTRLLDLGLLPRRDVEVVSVDRAGQILHLRIDGLPLGLAVADARAVRVATVATPGSTRGGGRTRSKKGDR